MAEVPMIYYRFEDDCTDEGNESLGYTLTQVATPTYATGKVDRAIDFEASTNQYAHKDDCTGSEIVKIRTIDFWIKPETVGALQIFFMIGRIYNDAILFSVASNNTVSVTYEGTGGDDFILNSSSTTSVGVWMHIVCVIGTGGAKLYINGNTTPEATDVSTGICISDFVKLFVGRREDGSNQYDGMVDNIALFDEQYSTADVTYSWNGGAGRLFIEEPVVENYVENKRKELKTKWPIEIGTTAATTKQIGKKYLHAQEGSIVQRKEKIGIGD